LDQSFGFLFFWRWFMHKLLHTAPVLLALAAGLTAGCNEGTSPSSHSSPASTTADPSREYVLTVEGMV
jgi:hypothetical protein